MCINSVVTIKQALPSLVLSYNYYIMNGNGSLIKYISLLLE